MVLLAGLVSTVLAWREIKSRQVLTAWAVLLFLVWFWPVASPLALYFWWRHERKIAPLKMVMASLQDAEEWSRRHP